MVIPQIKSFILTGISICCTYYQSVVRMVIKQLRLTTQKYCIRPDSDVINRIMQVYSQVFLQVLSLAVYLVLPVYLPMLSMFDPISYRSLTTPSSGACMTIIVDPNIESTHPSLPCRFSFSSSSRDDRTALHVMQRQIMLV